MSCSDMIQDMYATLCLFHAVQLSLLVAENSLLRRREAALQSAVTSLAGSVSAATQAVMVTSAADPAAALRATARAQPSDLRCSISDHKKFLLRMQQREAAVQVRMHQRWGPAQQQPAVGM